MAYSAQAMPPLKEMANSRLTVTIVALIAAAFILAAVYVYLQLGGKTQLPTVLTEEQKSRYIAAMQETIQSQPSLPQSQKAKLLQDLAKRLQAK